MSERTNTDHETPVKRDELGLCAADIEAAVGSGDFRRAAALIEQDLTGVWFSLGPTRAVEILRLILNNAPAAGPVLRAAEEILGASASDSLDSQASTVDFDDPREVFLLTVFRMGQYRLNGLVTEALEQSKELSKQFGLMQPLLGSPHGRELHTAVQIGVTAMLAGDFTLALTNFTRAQMHAPVPKFAFLTRDALTKSALIHACFGNSMTAKSLLKRATKVSRTSSWVESHIDAHHNFAEVLLTADDHDDALRKLDSISLHDIGEMWPFYILAVHRILEAGGHQDELEHRLEMFNALPFPKQDGDGFSGSVIVLKHALLAMKAGRGAEAQGFLDRADQGFPYTQLLQAAAHVHAGRPQQAIQGATRLRSETRGFRLMEVRRLAVLAAAQYQSNENADCVDTLKRAAEIPRGLTQQEIQLFSPEARELAGKKVRNWPTDNGGPSVFLTGLPQPGIDLTDREVEILRYLAQELTRAEMADAMFISVNTLKTHLKSVYRKLGVSSATDAVLGAQRRGLL